MEKGIRDRLKVVERRVKQSVVGQGIRKTIRSGLREASKLLDMATDNSSKSSTSPSNDEGTQSTLPSAVLETEVHEKTSSASAPNERSENHDKQGAPVNSEENNDHKLEATNDKANAGLLTKDADISVEYFEKWMRTLERSLSVPTLDEDVWKATLRGCNKCKDDLEQADKALEQSKKDNDSTDRIALLEEGYKAAKEEFEESLVHCQVVAGSILESPVFQSFLHPSDDNDEDWVTWRVLKSVPPKQWADWCNQDSQQMSEDIVAMLHSPDFLREILQEGGPRGDNYRNFLKIYQELGGQENIVHERLAMAVALEFANEDYGNFSGNGKVDPFQRYVHYQQAYLMGELDPAFPTLGVWELRMAVNSDASNEELSSGRLSLMNYRPDLILSQCDRWRYCHIVRTDVEYKAPDWYKTPRSFDQILSGGGKCGPRAWYGRFICKAFGIPTWGCRQPGHAAMTRWTRDEWVVCLGAGLHVSYWEGRGGPNFKLETDARRACSSPARYRQLVERLRWVALKAGEKGQSVSNKNEPSVSEPWSALALFQSKILAASTGMGDATNKFQTHDQVVSKIQFMKSQGDPAPGIPSWNQEKTRLIIPADCCFKPQQRNKVQFHASFSGGTQIFLQGDGVVEYALESKMFPDDLNNRAKRWALSFRVCTVHRAETDFMVTIMNEADKSTATLNAPLPYTNGEWQNTDPVTIELLGGPHKLSLTRGYKKFGIALKELSLCRIDSAE